MFTDPYGLFQDPEPGTQTAPSTGTGTALGILGRALGGLGLLLSPTALGDGTLPDNVIPFPGSIATPPNKCGPDDNNSGDPYERDRKGLPSNRDFFMNFANSLQNAGERARQIRAFATKFNPTVEAHNRVCSLHQVAPISVGPTLIP